jgi:glutathione S-transferase
MITVHHLGISQSERIVWLFEELGLPYVLKIYDRDATTRLAPAEYRALHPMGIAPVITDGDLTLGESGAIIEYVITKYAQGRLALPPSHPDYPQYLYWFHFANGTMMPGEMIGIIQIMLGVGNDNPMMVSLKSRGERAYALVEDRLGKVPYFAGKEFTAADIMMLFAMTTMRAFAPRDLARYPNVRAYLKRIGERPAYQRAMAKGDPGMPLQLS